MNYPIKKLFKKKIILKEWQKEKIFTYTYNQATIEEYLEFFNKNAKERYLECYEIIHKQCPKTIFERFLTIFFPDFIWKIERKLNIEEEVVEIMQNRFRTYKSIFSEIQEKKKSSNQKGFFASSLQIICKEYNISPDDLLKKYTLEQFLFFQDWIVYNMNMQTKEGQSENNIALIDKEALKKRAEETRKAFESIN